MRLIMGWLLLGYASVSFATTTSTAIFCQKYPKAVGCENTATSCGICHAGPPSLNAYGEDIKANLVGPIDTNLLVALSKIEGLDSDEDGSLNLDEINFLGAPGNPQIEPKKDINLVFDEGIALKRIKSTYCGTTATYADMQKLKAATDPKAILHQELSTCLESAYWTKEALFRMADKKIQPLAATGFGGPVVIGDYRFDYRLFSYIMSGDRDVRELLSAQYHIDAAGNKIEGVVAREEPFSIGTRIVIAGGQPLAPARRAGMLTTQWYLSNFTMFAVLPRNTASQAYRAYLGLDIAKGEGLMPMANEPRDVDSKRVAQADCAACHSTLDPISYAFSAYRGIEVSIALATGNPIGTYNAARTPWEAQGQVLGKPVANLLEWAETARNSEAFQRNIAKMMFEQALSRGPLTHEAEDFEELWKGLPMEGYSVNKMLHRFIETTAFAGKTP